MAIEDLDTKAELGRWITEYLEGEPLPQSAVEGIAELTPGKWNALTFEGGWSNYGGGYSPAAYRTIPGGGVQLRGLVQHASAVAPGTGIAALPKGVAPKERLVFSAPADLGGIPEVTRIDAWETGQVVYEGEEATVTYLSLSNVIFWPGS